MTDKVGPGLALIDSHAHLDFDSYANDRSAVLERAWSAGLRHIVTIGSGRDTQGAAEAVKLAAEDERIWASVGVHPHDADLGVAWHTPADEPVLDSVRNDWDRRAADQLRLFESLALHPKVVAIGEVGLDYHYDNSPRELQRELFARFIRLACELSLPLILHAREAEDELVELLVRERAEQVGGVIHCYSGHPGLARAGLEMGFSFGVTGVVTFKKAVALRQALADIPIERLLIETDSPYLAPVPYRGKRNEPAYVAHVARSLAEIKGLPAEQVAEITTQNSIALFGLDSPGKSGPGRIAYPLKNGLYLNISNRCSLACQFCLKRTGHELAGTSLALWQEPSAEDILAAVDQELQRERVQEVIFCGIGEPLLRPDVVLEVSRRLKARGLKVRVNTDGLANLVHGRDVLSTLLPVVDAFSVSLNAHDADTYVRLCPSEFGSRAFDEVCDFIRRATAALSDVRASVVRLPEVDLEAARLLAESLGAAFLVRG